MLLLLLHDNPLARRLLGNFLCALVRALPPGLIRDWVELFSRPGWAPTMDSCTCSIAL